MGTLINIMWCSGPLAPHLILHINTFHFFAQWETVVRYILLIIWFGCSARDLRPLALWDYWKFILYIFLILVEFFETFSPSLCDCWNLKVYFKDSMLWTFGSSFVKLLIFFIEAVLRTFSPSLVRLLVVRIILYIIYYIL